MTATLELEWRALPHQLEALLWRPSPIHVRGTKVGLGGIGSGKTAFAAAGTIVTCSENGWRPEYGRKVPIFLCLGPTLSHAAEKMLSEVDSILPRQAIRKVRGKPTPTIQLTNGTEIRAYAFGSGTWQGETACGLWIDEIQDERIARNQHRLIMARGRIRDPLAPRPMMYVTGLPTAGFVREHFHERLNSARQHTWRWSLEQNTFLTQEYIEGIYDDCPAGQEEHVLRGEWGTYGNALYPQFDADTHCVDLPAPDPNVPCSIGIDAGNRSALEVGQPIKVDLVQTDGTIKRNQKGLLIVDEILGDGASLRELCVRFKDSRKWKLVRGASRIYPDPTLSRDELRVFREEFPGIGILQRDRGDDLHDVKRGVRLIQSSLKNARGNVRLFFARHLLSNRKGVIESLIELRTTPSGNPAVDDLRDHPNDALRYLVCGILGRGVMAPEA